MTIRNAVRIFCIKNDEVVVKKYNTHDEGYLDIPGGKIEDGESEFDACKRELKEETNLDLISATKTGIIKIYYPHNDKLYLMHVYVADKFEGEIENFEEDDAMYLKIDEVLKNEKRWASTQLLSNEYKDVFYKEDYLVEFTCAEDHSIIDNQCDKYINKK